MQNKLQGIPKGKITQFEETEQALEPDIVGMSELSDEEFYLNNCDYYFRGSTGLCRQYEKTGGQWKQRDGNPKKELKNPRGQKYLQK